MESTSQSEKTSEPEDMILKVMLEAITVYLENQELMGITPHRSDLWQMLTKRQQIVVHEMDALLKNYRRVHLEGTRTG